jgi:hypothetical protein
MRVWHDWCDHRPIIQYTHYGGLVTENMTSLIKLIKSAQKIACSKMVFRQISHVVIFVPNPRALHRHQSRRSYDNKRTQRDLLH